MRNAIKKIVLAIYILVCLVSMLSLSIFIRPVTSQTSEIPTATITGSAPTDLPTTYRIEGFAFYQNRESGNSGIEIRVFDSEQHLLITVVTDAAGGYTVDLPEDNLYLFTVTAPLHISAQFPLIPGQNLPPILILNGGDLNGDGCIGLADLSLFTATFETADPSTIDINGNGLADASDLAILAGNLNNDCYEVIPTPEPSGTPTPTLTATEITGPISIPYIDSMDNPDHWIATGWATDSQVAYVGTSWFADSSQRDSLHTLEHEQSFDFSGADYPLSRYKGWR